MTVSPASRWLGTMHVAGPTGIENQNIGEPRPAAAIPMEDPYCAAVG